MAKSKVITYMDLAQDRGIILQDHLIRYKNMIYSTKEDMKRYPEKIHITPIKITISHKRFKV